MITVLKRNATAEQKEHLISWLKAQGLDVHISEGQEYTVLGLIGDTSRIDMDLIASLDIVESSASRSPISSAAGSSIPRTPSST